MISIMNFSSFRLMNRIILRRLSRPELHVVLGLFMILRPQILNPFPRGFGYGLPYVRSAPLALYHAMDVLFCDAELTSDLNLFYMGVKKSLFYFGFDV